MIDHSRKQNTDQVPLQPHPLTPHFQTSPACRKPCAQGSWYSEKDRDHASRLRSSQRCMTPHWPNMVQWGCGGIVARSSRSSRADQTFLAFPWLYTSLHIKNRVSTCINWFRHNILVQICNMYSMAERCNYESTYITSC